MDKKTTPQGSSDSITDQVQKLVEAGSKVAESHMNFHIYSENGVQEIPVILFVVRDPDVAKKISQLLSEL